MLHEYAGKMIETTADGFLADSAQWTPEVGEALASEVGLRPLSEKHWQVITFCREDAAKEGQSPTVRRIAKLSGVSMKELYELFPKGPGKLAAKIAGLPKPQGCV
ncbi:MAG TPA: TusE/DsrC/DsvC family sulfur relay protein [Thermoanaerobaculia bacterium]|nr:TusE/DsrC/DsvC family sulfur relay protein [Thermoanaerobaculia bacterium]